ncbi:MAG: Wzz/FepE/Etk N-terminal domain-containing protein [Acidobacteriota bacterium]
MQQSVVSSEYGVGNVPRRVYDVEDYLNIVRRNWQWIIGPLLAGLTIATVGAFFWPNTFVSAAAIRVVPPQVPERLVPTNVNVQMGERVRTMAQTILSRNTLTNIITTYDLYRKDRGRFPMEDVIESMRKDISIGGIRNLGGRDNGSTAFQISFSYENRYVAQKVTRDLMTRFIDENIRERSQQSQMTTQFLREQYDEAKRELESIEQKITIFRNSNQGRLPEQMDMNLTQINALDQRINSLNTSMSRANQDRLILEAELRALREKMASIAKNATPPPGSAAARTQQNAAAAADPVLTRMNNNIAQMESALQQMLDVYKESYPDVPRLRQRITAARRDRDNYVNSTLAIPPSAGGAGTDGPVTNVPVVAGKSREIVDIEADVERLRGQIRARELEAERYLREIAETEQKQRGVQSRIEAGPAGAQSYELLMRDREAAKSKYDEYSKKLNNSSIATDLENRKQGETLEVLDLPSLPETPTAPHRPMIIGAGALLGLVLGFALVAFREAKDGSLKTLKDVRTYTQYVVLGSFPLLENDLIIRRRRRIAWLGWSTGIILALVLIGFSVYYYYSVRL